MLLFINVFCMFKKVHQLFHLRFFQTGLKCVVLKTIEENMKKKKKKKTRKILTEVRLSNKNKLQSSINTILRGI